MNDSDTAIGSIARTVRRLAAWRSEHDLTAHQAEVLVQVYDAGAVTAAALCRGLGLSTASMARLIARLEQDGWLLRMPDTSDGRRQIVQPTKLLVRALERLEVAPVLDPVVGGVTALGDTDSARSAGAPGAP